MFGRVIGVLLLGAFGSPWGNLHADENKTIESKIGGRQCKMVLTGSAVRTKSIFKVYAIDSYIEHGAGIRTAEDMIAVDGPKQLHLVMLRTVAGPDMADAFIAQL